MTTRIISSETAQLEAEWRKALIDKSLVLEAGVDIDLATNSFANVLSTYLRFSAPDDRKQVLAKYGAHVLVGLTAVGTKGYEAGTFWPKVAELAELDDLTQFAQYELSNQFRTGLQHFKLSRFETPLRNVGEILMHSGVPFASHCNLIKLMNYLEGREYGVDGEFLVDYCLRVGRDELNIQFGLGNPTFRFITSAGRIAEDYIDQLFQLISTAAGEKSQTSLPPGVVDAVTKCVEIKNLHSSRSRTTTTQRLDRKIRVRFDPSRGVHLELPLFELLSRTDVMWEIESLGKVTHIPRPEPYPGVIPEPERWPIREPSDLVRVNLLPSNNSQNIQVINPDDPLLVFEERTGNLVQGTIPRGRAWIGFPEGSLAANVQDYFDIKGNLSFIGLQMSIYGWEGWSFIHADLTGCDSIALHEGAYADGELLKIGPVRNVDATRSPYLSGEEPFSPWLNVVGSRFCFGEAPELVLPAMQSSEGEWRLRVIDLLSGVTVIDSLISYETIETRQVLEITYSSTFELEVVGPLGRGLREKFTILRGINFIKSTEFRRQRTDEAGLESALIRIDSPEFRAIEVTFDEAEDRKRVEIPLPSGAISVMIELPAQLIFTTVGRGKTFSWITPANIATELAANCRIAVRTPVGLERPLEIRHHGEVLQRIKGRRNGNELVYNLAEASDTLEASHVGELGVVFDGLFFPVGSIRPRKIVRGITLVGQDLVLDLEDIGKPVSVAIYPRFAPWRSPYVHRLAVGVSRVTLTPEEVAEGWLDVAVRVENAWKPAEWPRHLESEHEERIIVKLGPPDESCFDVSESTLRIWLSGEGDLSVTSENLTTCFKLYEQLLLKAARFTRVPESIRRELSQHLLVFIDQIPNLLHESDIAKAAKIALLAQTVAFNRTGGSLAKNHGEIASLGLLSLVPGEHLSSLGYEEIIRTLGTSAKAILLNGEDPDFAIPNFKDEFAMIVDKWPIEKLDEIWKTLNPVPSRVLDSGQRAINGRELFDVRHNSNIRSLTARKGEIISAAADLCESGEFAKLKELLMARSQGSDWRDLPAISIGFAILARGSARGYSKYDALLENLNEEFSYFVWKATHMAQQDLALAELWMARKEGVTVDEV